MSKWYIASLSDTDTGYRTAGTLDEARQILGVKSLSWHSPGLYRVILGRQSGRQCEVWIGTKTVMKREGWANL